MSFKTSLIKMVINWTPHMIIIWVANFMLKGIAEITDYDIDLDTRKAYLETKLYGEAEIIEVWLDGFVIVSDEYSKYFIIHQAQSNRPWLHNLLARIVGKSWKIPAIPQFENQMELIAELLKPENPEQEEIE